MRCSVSLASAGEVLYICDMETPTPKLGRHLTVRIRRTARAKLLRLAKADKRSVPATIETLAEQELARRQAPSPASSSGV